MAYLPVQALSVVSQSHRRFQETAPVPGIPYIVLHDPQEVVLPVLPHEGHFCTPVMLSQQHCPLNGLFLDHDASLFTLAELKTPQWQVPCVYLSVEMIADGAPCMPLPKSAVSRGSWECTSAELLDQILVQQWWSYKLSGAQLACLQASTARHSK